LSRHVPLFVALVLALGPVASPVAQTAYTYPQLRLVRQIAVATYLAELCNAGISDAGVAKALRSEGLREQDLQSAFLKDEMAKQRIAIRDSYEALSMTILGRSEAFRRQCAGLETNYGPRGTVRRGLAIRAARSSA